jgi:hypothetical protein
MAPPACPPCMFPACCIAQHSYEAPSESHVVCMATLKVNLQTQSPSPVAGRTCCAAGVHDGGDVSCLGGLGLPGPCLAHKQEVLPAQHWSNTSVLKALWTASGTASGKHTTANVSDDKQQLGCTEEHGSVQKGTQTFKSNPGTLSRKCCHGQCTMIELQPGYFHNQYLVEGEQGCNAAVA